MIDLHTHTTASDGRCTPDELVARAAAAGIRTLSVTDHDTTAGVAAAERACRERQIDLVPGIEITAVADDLDVHVLGYFIDRESPALQEFLRAQRDSRLNRLRRMMQKLGNHGMRLDADAVLQPALDDPTKAAGRPWIARAMVEAGYSSDVNDAFTRWLSRGRPAFVPRSGAPPADVCERIHHAGGAASLAHPGLLKRDDWIRTFAESGLDAIEAYHSEHDAAATARYLAIAKSLKLAVSGGSDYHATDAHGAVRLGSINLPDDCFAELARRARG
ncbi:MAG TPA: PHP domain-containing protein [Vicinamibacterales bacterium]|nr:PHP domain-containing protein [Vicinamibacterales bacterium]